MTPAPHRRDRGEIGCQAADFRCGAMRSGRRQRQGQTVTGAAWQPVSVLFTTRELLFFEERQNAGHQLGLKLLGLAEESIGLVHEAPGIDEHGQHGAGDHDHLGE